MPVTTISDEIIALLKKLSTEHRFAPRLIAREQ